MRSNRRRAQEESVLALLHRSRVGDPSFFQRVLDLGAGQGLLTLPGWPVPDPRFYMGLEADPIARARLRRSHPLHPVIPLQHRGPRFAFNDKTTRYDAVVGLWSAFSVWAEPEPACRQLVDLLRPGGALFLMAPGPAAKDGSARWYGGHTLAAMFALRVGHLQVRGLGMLSRKVPGWAPLGLHRFAVEQECRFPRPAEWVVITGKRL